MAVGLSDVRFVAESGNLRLGLGRLADSGARSASPDLAYLPHLIEG